MKKISINIRDPRLRVPLLVALFIGIGTYMWIDMVFAALQIERSQLLDNINRRQDTLRIIQALKPQLAQLHIELNLAQHRLDSLKAMFPDQKEVPKLIREITSVARAAGIVTTRFSPMPDIEREYFVENRYSLAVEGGYHSLAEFFSFLANFTLIINLSTVNITANPAYVDQEAAGPESGRYPTIAALFEMTTFSSKK